MVSFGEPQDLAILFRDLEPVVLCESGFQRIEILRHRQLGLILIINGEVQHVEEWQALYHEPLVHVPASFVTELKQVLVLGGGSLFAAAQLLHYSTIQRCVLVDHDPTVLSLMRENYSHAAVVQQDRRFVYVPQDAEDYLLSTSNKFDLIINDSFDLSAHARDGQSMFGLMKARLEEGGACADVTYRHLFDKSCIGRTRTLIHAARPYALSLVVVPEYPGILHLLTIWGGAHITQDASIPRNKLQLAWCDSLDRPPIKFYNPRFLKFHLYIPPYLRQVWHA